MKKITVAVCDDEKGIMRMVQGAIENAFELHGIDAEVDGFLSASDLSAAMKTRKWILEKNTVLCVPFLFLRKSSEVLGICGFTRVTS